MDVLRVFWSRLAIWTGALFAMLMAVAALAGDGHTPLLARVPVWLGFALALGSFPAGIAAADTVLSRGSVRASPIGAFLGSAVGVSVLFFILAGWVGPWLAAGPVSPAFDSIALTLPELGQEARGAAIAADGAGVATVEAWRKANDLMWEYDSRMVGSLLPGLFALIGMFTGFWVRRIPRPDLRQTLYWMVGLFLLVTTYFAGENSYELIVAQSAGPAFFAAWIRLIVPFTLVLSMGCPTVIRVWEEQAPT